MKKRGTLTIHAGRSLFANPWIELTAYEVSAPSGRRFEYTTVDFKRAATGVVPLHDDGTVTLVGQHRFPLDVFSWELPEGGAEPSEPPLVEVGLATCSRLGAIYRAGAGGGTGV